MGHLTFDQEANCLFKFIQILNRFSKEPVGYPYARLITRGPEHLDYQLQHLYIARVHQWIEAAAHVQQRNLFRRIASVQCDLHGKPKAG